MQTRQESRIAETLIVTSILIGFCVLAWAGVIYVIYKILQALGAVS